MIRKKLVKYYDFNKYLYVLVYLTDIMQSEAHREQAGPASINQHLQVSKLGDFALNLG